MLVTCDRPLACTHGNKRSSRIFRFYTKYVIYSTAKKETQQKDFTKELSMKLQQIEMQPEIQTALIFWTTAWLTNEPQWSTSIAHAIQQQGKIG
jgi:hypothetical protein